MTALLEALATPTLLSAWPPLHSYSYIANSLIKYMKYITYSDPSSIYESLFISTSKGWTLLVVFHRPPHCFRF